MTHFPNAREGASHDREGEPKSPELPQPDDDRYGRDEVTGLEYVKRRPGRRMVTSEEVRQELEDFP